MEEKRVRAALHPAVSQAGFRDPHDLAKWGPVHLATEQREAVKDLPRVTGWGWGAGWDPGHWYRCSIAGRVNGPGSRTGRAQVPPDQRAAQVSCSLARDAGRRLPLGASSTFRTRRPRAQHKCLGHYQRPHHRPAMPWTCSGLRASESQHPPCSVCSQELNFRDIPLPSPPDRPAKPPLHSQNASDTAHFCSHVIKRRFFQLSALLPHRLQSHLPFPPKAHCLDQERGHPPHNSRTG